MWPSIINVLALTAVIILVFILQVLPAKSGDRNLYLLMLLLYLFIHLLGGLFMLNGLFNLRIYAMFSLSIVVLYGPTYYFYIRRFHGLATNNYPWHVIFLEIGLWVPILLHSLYILTTPKAFYNLYYTIALLIYYVQALRVMSSIHLKRGKDWMRTLTIGFGGLILLYIMESAWMSLTFRSVDRIVMTSATIYNLFCFVFILISIKQIITRPSVFSNMRIRIPSRRESTKDFEIELESIVTYVVHQKEYKDPNINRNAISEATGLGVHRISEIINSQFNKNFNDWINDHRIKDAKWHLVNSQLSIKEICYEVGFNSKSVFNYAFKKRIDMTPTEYRIKSLS